MAYYRAVALRKRVPLLDRREMVDGKTTVYLCEQFTCKAPVTDAEGLKTQLESTLNTAGNAAAPKGSR